MELTMNLPRNYVEIEEEQIMYLDGGSMTMLYKNIKGLWGRSQGFRMSCKAVGITLGTIGTIAKMSYIKAVCKFGYVVTRTALTIGGFWLAGIALAGTAAFMIYLYNKRTFY